MYTYSDVEAIQPDNVIARFTWLVICCQGTALLHRRAGLHVRQRRFDYEVVHHVAACAGQVAVAATNY